MSEQDCGPFYQWPLKKQIAHIRKCQANGIEAINNGSPRNLADIADHLDLWGPWLCEQVEKLSEENERLKSRNAELVEVLYELANNVTMPEKYSSLAVEALKTNQGGEHE